MRHATAERIEALDAVLRELRALDGLVEKRPGVFYRKSRAFLHFHEDGDATYADLRLEGPEFTRLPVNTTKQQQRLVSKVRKAIGQ